MLDLRTGTGQCWLTKKSTGSNKWLQHKEVFCDAKESPETRWTHTVIQELFQILHHLQPDPLKIKNKMVLTSQGIRGSEME